MAAGVGRERGPGIPAGGGGTSSRSLRVLIGMERKGTRSGSPHELIAIRAPGLRKPRTRPAAASASGSKMIPQRETAASKLACGQSRLAASDSMNSTLPRPAAAARSRPNASISAEMSVATTRPSGPALRAAVSAGSP